MVYKSNKSELWKDAIRRDDIEAIKRIVRLYGIQTSLAGSLCTALNSDSQKCFKYFRELLMTDKRGII